jgi:uncharacterized membrane protein
MSDIPTSDDFGPITQDDKLYAGLCYLFSPLFPIIIFISEEKKSRPFIKEHLMQSLAVGIVIAIISVIPIVFCIAPLFWLYNVYNAFRAYQGESFDIPLVTDFITSQNW